MPPEPAIGADGWHLHAERLPSPNFDARPDPAPPQLLVIHNISLPAGEFGGPHIAALFLNCLDHAACADFESLRDLRVSAHFLIRRDGSLQQFVSANDRAWHAGLSSWRGRDRCNDFSIGVELEGSDFLPFESMQYQTLAQLTRDLCARYPIANIVGHQDIAPGRKTDPGPFFDWSTYRDACLGSPSAPSALALTDTPPGFPALG